MSPVLPPINTSVTVRVPGWPTAGRTRVEDSDADLVLAAPAAPDGAPEPALGASVDVTWQAERGPMALRARLVAKAEGVLSTWRLTPEGPAVLTQRRRHVRAGIVLPVVLHADDGRLDAHVIDLSEGGIRIACSRPRALAVGDRFEVQLEVDERELVLPMEVVRVEVDRTPCLAGCRFTAICEGDAAAVRRFVFGRQARERVRP